MKFQIVKCRDCNYETMRTIELEGNSCRRCNGLVNIIGVQNERI